MRIHRDRFLQHIIQVKPRPAVYDKGSLGENILVHLVQRVPELGHPHTIQVKDQSIEIPGILAAATPPEVGQRRHDGKIRIKDLGQLRKLIGNGVASGLSISLDLHSDPRSLRYRHRNPVAFLVLKMALPLKTAHREDLPIKLKGCDRLQEPLQMLVLFPVQFPQLLHSSLLIHSHTFTSKRKSSKKKIRCGGDRLGPPAGGKGGKGEPKSGPSGALKRKSPPPFPPGSGHGNDGKPYRVYHIPTASAHPPFPLRLSPI